MAVQTVTYPRVSMLGHIRPVKETGAVPAYLAFAYLAGLVVVFPLHT